MCSHEEKKKEVHEVIFLHRSQPDQRLSDIVMIQDDFFRRHPQKYHFLRQGQQRQQRLFVLVHSGESGKRPFVKSRSGRGHRRRRRRRRCRGSRRSRHRGRH